MRYSEGHKSRIGGLDVWMALAGIASALLLILAATQTQAQTFQVLHNFTGGRDGANPGDGLTIDRNGNLYGTSVAGGNQIYGCEDFERTTGCGAVWELAHAGPGWVLKPLYDFDAHDGTANPNYGVTIGPDGALYGFTNGPGFCDSNPCGNVYRVAPPPTPCAGFRCDWQETLLYQFGGQPDGAGPAFRAVFDASGNMYGMTFGGGVANLGTVFELSPTGGGGWTESVIYSFRRNTLDGGTALPDGPIVMDPAGNIYGAAECNLMLGCFYGAVYQLQPSPGSWTLNSLFQFNGGNGYEPVAMLRDEAGNLYGTNFGDGGHDSGNVYELSPSNSGWNFTELYNYGGFGGDTTEYLVMDSAGNIYGGTSLSGNGTIFKLTRSGNGWTSSILHSFNGADGSGAGGRLIIDSAGNLYGTAGGGGAYGYGVIWEITP